MEEWEKHVTTEEGSKEYFCGVSKISFDWFFLDAEHAKASADQNTRLQPCPACLSKIKE